MTRLVFLDDYQGVAQELAPLDRLGDLECASVLQHLEGDELVEALAGADIVVAMRERTRFDRSLLERLADLRLLVTTGPANAAIDLVATSELGIVVSATGGRGTANTAEHTWALILAVQRHLVEEAVSIRDGGWQHTIGTDLSGSTLGLVGLGRIGRQMAAIGHAFDMEVLAWSQNLDPNHARELGVEPVAKEELFSRADVVSVHLVLSGRSRGLIGAPELARMKSSAIIVNSSRGPIIEEAALLEALESEAIAGAGLDVFDVEPLPIDHPLRSAPRCVVTPHLGYVTWRTLREWYEDVVEDIEAFLAGAPIRVLEPPAGR